MVEVRSLIPALYPGWRAGVNRELGEESLRSQAQCTRGSAVALKRARW